MAPGIASARCLTFPPACIPTHPRMRLCVCARVCAFPHASQARDATVYDVAPACAQAGAFTTPGLRARTLHAHGCAAKHRRLHPPETLGINMQPIEAATRRRAPGGGCKRSSAQRTTRELIQHAAKAHHDTRDPLPSGSTDTCARTGRYHRALTRAPPPPARTCSAPPPSEPVHTPAARFNPVPIWDRRHF